jgi:glutathione reductase (NADPH)
LLTSVSENQEEKGKKKKFDLIVIGTGVAASTVVHKCRSAGWEVAVIDSRPFGGTCALRGCDPKKVLVGAAEVIDTNQRMEGKGVIINRATGINWQELMRFKRSFTEPVPESREKSFQKAGIVTFHGRARFTGPATVKVGDDDNDNDNTDQSLEAHHILIATGSRPMKMNIPGEEYLTTSDEFLELDKLPDRIVFVGGGYISFEFAHVAARAGAKAITIIHRGVRPLGNFDPDLVNMIVERTRNLGIDVLLQTEVKSIEKKKPSSSSSANKKFAVNIVAASDDSNKAGKKKERLINADMVVHGAGRNPEIEDLGLEKAGVEYGKRGVKVNEHLQSVSNPAVYAAGDCAASGGLPLTPIASYDGQVAANNLLDTNKVAADYKGTPSVVFTIPPLASVGLLEEDASKSGLKFKRNYSSTSGWYSSRRINESHSGFKVLIEEGTDRILGAHLLGPHAEEVINIFAMAIRLELKASDLRKALWSYPTNASDITYML